MFKYWLKNLAIYKNTLFFRPKYTFHIFIQKKLNLIFLTLFKILQKQTPHIFKTIFFM